MSGPLIIALPSKGRLKEQVEAWLQTQGFSLRHVVLDPGARLGLRVGSTGLPTTLFYDAGGRFVAGHMGMLSSASLAARLSAMAPTRASLPASTSR